MADLDAALKMRLRAVLDGEPCTEAELRRLFEEGRACKLLLTARLERAERDVAALDSDSQSSLTALADAVRRATELRPDLEELDELLGELDARARRFRAAWLGNGR